MCLCRRRLIVLTWVACSGWLLQRFNRSTVSFISCFLHFPLASCLLSTLLLAPMLKVQHPGNILFSYYHLNLFSFHPFASTVFFPFLLPLSSARWTVTFPFISLLHLPSPFCLFSHFLFPLIFPSLSFSFPLLLLSFPFFFLSFFHSFFLSTLLSSSFPFICSFLLLFVFLSFPLPSSLSFPLFPSVLHRWWWSEKQPTMLLSELKSVEPF